MDYLKRKKQILNDVLKEAFMTGYHSAQFGNPPCYFENGALVLEVHKLIDQVYKRGLKDGAKKV